MKNTSIDAVEKKLQINKTNAKQADNRDFLATKKYHPAKNDASDSPYAKSIIATRAELIGSTKNRIVITSTCALLRNLSVPRI